MEQGEQILKELREIKEEVRIIRRKVRVGFRFTWTFIILILGVVVKLWVGQ